MTTGLDIVKAAYELFGAPYRAWSPGWPIPMWVADGVGNPPSADHLLEVGVECTDLVNYAEGVCGLDYGGGTQSFPDHLVNVSAFDPSVPGQPGAIALKPYSGPDLHDQGHIAIYVEEHTLIQAIGEGVTDKYSDEETCTWPGCEFTVYGFLPGVSYPIVGDQAAEWKNWQKYGWYELDANSDAKWHPGELNG